MKKLFLIGLLAAGTILGSSFIGQEKEVNVEYPETFIVYEANAEENYIILRDFNGHLFRWNNCEDWLEGDIASAVMDSNGTEGITDDRIVMLKYSGYLD